MYLILDSGVRCLSPIAARDDVDDESDECFGVDTTLSTIHAYPDALPLSPLSRGHAHAVLDVLPS
jgi:hypothetical protein